MEKRFYILAIIILSTVLPLFAQQNFVIILHKSVEGESLTRTNIESIFLGKKSRWSNGIKIVPVNLKSGEVYNTFIQTMIRKSPNAYTNYWRKMIFTGKGVMPLNCENEIDMLNYVNKTPGAIGYISNNTETGKHENVVVAQTPE